MDPFDECHEINIQQFIDKSKNLNTTKATSQWMRVYLSWAEIKGAALEIESLPPVDLNRLLQQFYAEVKRKDGKDYEPNSFASMQTGIERHLKEKQYKLSIIRDREFTTSTAVLELVHLENKVRANVLIKPLV